MVRGETIEKAGSGRVDVRFTEIAAHMASGVVARSLPDRTGAVDLAQENPFRRSVGDGRFLRMRIQRDQFKLLQKGLSRKETETEEPVRIPPDRNGELRKPSGSDADGAVLSFRGEGLPQNVPRQIADPETQILLHSGKNRIVEQFDDAGTVFRIKFPDPGGGERTVKGLEFVDRSLESAFSGTVRPEAEGLLKFQHPGRIVFLRDQIPVEIKIHALSVPGQCDMVPLPGENLADPRIIVESPHRHPFQKGSSVHPEESRRHQRPDPAGAVKFPAPDAVLIRVPVPEVQTAPRRAVLTDPERKRSLFFSQKGVVHAVDQSAVLRDLDGLPADPGNGFHVPHLDRRFSAEGEIPLETAVAHRFRKGMKSEAREKEKS